MLRNLPKHQVKSLDTPSSRQRSGNAEAVNDHRLLYRTTIFYTAMQDLRRIMEKPHGSIGRWSPRQGVVVEVWRSGVTPIAFWIRENRRVRGLPIFLRKHLLLFSSLQASLLVYSVTAIQISHARDGFGVQAFWRQ